MPLVPAPKPGIYPGEPFATYALWDAVNHSRLRMVDQSPLHFQQSIREETPALVVGKAAHLALLEPDAFSRKVRIGPINERTGACFGYDTKSFAQAQEADPDSILLSKEDMQSCAEMRRAVWNHPAAKDILTEKALDEVSIVWKDKATGLLCKARGDRVSKRWWVDFKTTENASPVEFAKSIVNFGYDTAQAFYDEGREALGIDASPVLIVAEKRPPYAVAVYEIGQETMDAARQRVREWKGTLARCFEEKKWPGYDEGIVNLEAPAWHLAKFAAGE